MEGQFVCKLCGERFEKRDALIEHGLEDHRNGDPKDASD